MIQKFCPVCEQETSTVRDGLHWCDGCQVGWESPRLYARRRGLRPHTTRKEIVGRKPWHHRGDPVVVLKKDNR